MLAEWLDQGTKEASVQGAPALVPRFVDLNQSSIISPPQLNNPLSLFEYDYRLQKYDNQCMFRSFFIRKKIASSEEDIRESILNFSKLLHRKALIYAVFSQFPDSASMWYSRSNIRCSKSELIAALKKGYVHIRDDEEAKTAWWLLRHHVIRIVPDAESEPVNLLNCDHVREAIRKLEKELDEEFSVYEHLRKSLCRESIQYS